VFTFISCSPRDEIVEGQLGSFSSTVISVEKDGAKLPTCTTKEGDEKPKPTWNTIRFFHELNFIFPKVKNNELSIIVSKGDFNCVKISSDETVELETQIEPRGKDYEKTGAFVYVKKLEIMDTGYLLNNTALMSEFADGMGMSVGQLSTYLKSSPVKTKVNITYVSKTKGKLSDDDKPKDDGGDSNSKLLTYLKLPGDQGKTAGDCGSEWTSLRLQKWFIEEHAEVLKNKIEDKGLKVFVGAGDRHCLPLGASGRFETLQDDGSFTLFGPEYIVEAVILRKKSDFFEDPILLEYVARDAGMSVEMFVAYLENMKNDVVNMTFIKWDNLLDTPEEDL
jgi:hypothetical protein